MVKRLTAWKANPWNPLFFKGDLVIQVGNRDIRRGDLHLFSTHQLTFEENGFYWVTGPNGSGKTTFLKALPKISIEQNPSSQKKIGFISTLQHYDRSLPLKGQQFFKIYTPDEKALQNTPFGFLGEKFIFEMSSGEFQALLLCAHLNSEAQILIMDEPFSHLSQEWMAYFLESFQKFSKTKLIILANHQYKDPHLQGIQYLNISQHQMKALS